MLALLSLALISRSIEVARYSQISWRRGAHLFYSRIQSTDMSSLTSITMSSSRENSVYLAKLAEQAERYEGTIPPPPPTPNICEF